MAEPEGTATTPDRPTDRLTESAPSLAHGIASALARRFTRIVVFSGAGISAESGIPTFRSGGDSLWRQFQPGELATPEAWQRDKDLVWGWYEWRRGLIMRAHPNPAHRAAAQLQRNFGADIVTQNVDDLHERAGAAHVLHLHGSIFAARCFACARPCALRDPPQEAQQRLAPPCCTHCGGFVRPGVVWFGEQLPADVVRQTMSLIRQCDLLIIVGTSGVVQPAAAMVDAAPTSAVIVEVNPEATATVEGRRMVLPWPAGRGLPAILDALAAGSAA